MLRKVAWVQLFLWLFSFSLKKNLWSFLFVWLVGFFKKVNIILRMKKLSLGENTDTRSKDYKLDMEWNFSSTNC